MNDATIRIPFGDWAEVVVHWLTTTLGPVFDVLRAIFGGFYDIVYLVLGTPPFWAVIIVLVAIGYWAGRWKLALGTLIGLFVIVSVDQWDNAMKTLALVLVASTIAVLISIPVGIWAARSNTVSSIVKPVLDFMQTMPAFVYLIPALVLFRIGVVPGIVATIIFALAPGVRMTELGIRGVDREVVEAARSFGATPARILRQVQLPLAMPSIMAGVNQVIMLSLSMVVIAGMVGAGGLGADVVQSLNRIDVALGFEAGISVVVLAMILDRMTSAFAKHDRTRRTKREAKTSAEDESVAEKVAQADLELDAANAAARRPSR
ncbi:proline/glycine betaine ABC transporter permease [Pseudoclavibacter chungangensis]|uniref:Proline/glycine betaine ABC transporter permease n=1 Tax=Pseudoclavibacter chungangensis TaxID=587635 RepID=A0A7J5C2R1_9MICO|nr:proline/glycine betaine ABC transporter permease [Pseudoclavibacter chungangensis]KAB1660382.1 proline/glycine betaine ABC transporter permease [Pseudoclavibacter chungangensis]NYJ65746.1 ABC-type proline/glycine betaine transport system permease subunit [Pseudoclavibacter chungangensis]